MRPLEINKATQHIAKTALENNPCKEQDTRIALAF